MCYTTFPIQEQAPKSRWNFKLKPVYVIGILDFEYDTNVKYWQECQLLRSFALRDDKGILMTDNLHFKFLQLPFFTKEKHQLRTQFDKWCYFLKNLETMDTIPAILNEPIFQEAFDLAELSNMEKMEYILYQISKNKKYEMNIITEEAEEHGMERGMARGMEKRDTENILKFHKKGIRFCK